MVGVSGTAGLGHSARKKPLYTILYVQVLFAIVLGGVVGWLFPDIATNDWIKALGDGFIKLIKMVIAPIIFCTVVSGIAHIQDAKKVGRVGVKALVYFEVVSTFALVIGLIVGNLFQVGHGLRRPRPNAAAVAKFASEAQRSEVGRFRSQHHSRQRRRRLREGRHPAGAAVLDPVRLRPDGPGRARARTVRDLIDDVAHAVFGVIAIVMKAAPFGAFGAMAFTIGKFGPRALGNLVGLIAPST